MSPPSNDAHGSNDDEQRGDQRSAQRRTRHGHPPSSFDLEPNPFEQSFSRDKDAHSKPAKSPTPPHKHAAPPSASTPKPVLPSLAALSSPSDGYTWSDLAGSLRSGPLSPAMLQGPAAQPAHAPLPFDPARPFARTGLTPSTGLTPLVGGPVSFPPPSPNTAAFLAMVTNASSAAQIAPSPATITPNTLNAITGMIGPQQSQTTIAPAATTTAAAVAPGIPAVAPHPYPYSQQNGYPPSAAAATASAANGLFLLSQAHQELTKREEAQARAGGAVAPDAATSQGRRGAKRKSIDGPPPARGGAAHKRPRAAPRGRRAKASASAEDDDDSIDEDEMRTAVDEEHENARQNGHSKKPETEEEKRRNFLERNRQAALKCRQRKKAWLAKLQAEVEFLKNENERLTTALVSSRDEISRLNALLGATGGGVGGGPGVGMGGVGQGQPVSVSVSLPPAGKGMVAQSDSPSTGGAPPVSVVNGRGYGY